MEISPSYQKGRQPDLKNAFYLIESLFRRVRTLELNPSTGGSGGGLPLTGGTLTGSITAPSFIRTGGLASQFLKADGSIDSTVYAANSALASYVPLAGTSALAGNVISNNDVYFGSKEAGGTIRNLLGINTSNFAVIGNTNINSSVQGVTLDLSSNGGNGIRFYNSGVNNMRLFAATGNLVIQGGGTFVDNGQKLQVTGTSLFTGASTFNSSVTIGGNVAVSSGLNLGNSSAPTHTITLVSTSNGYAHYNTADQTTNWERVRGYWSGDVYNILVEKLGTGQLRNMSLSANASAISFGITGLAPFTNSAADIRRTGSQGSVLNIGGSMSSTNQVGVLAITPEIVQTGASASYRVIYASPYINTVGGTLTNYLIDVGTNTAQYGTLANHTSRFSVDNAGNVINAGTITSTGAITTNNRIRAITDFSTSITDVGGADLRIESRIITNSGSAASSTVTHYTARSLAIPTFAATNTSVTYTNATNLYIAGPPAAGTNVTITNPWSFYVNSGKTYLGGDTRVQGNVISTHGIHGTGLVNSLVGLTTTGMVSQVDSNADYGAVFSAMGNSPYGNYNYFFKSRSTDGNTSAAVQAGDNVMLLISNVDVGGGTRKDVASIETNVKTISGSIATGEIGFYVKNASDVMTRGIYILNDGNVVLQNSGAIVNNGEKLQVSGNVTASTFNPSVAANYGLGKNSNDLMMSGVGGVYFQDFGQGTQYFFSSHAGTKMSTSGGARTLNSAAVLEVNSTTKGVLFPRMTTTQRDAITTPPAGLQVWDTTTEKVSHYTNATAGWMDLKNDFVIQTINTTGATLLPRNTFVRYGDIGGVINLPSGTIPAGTHYMIYNSEESAVTITSASSNILYGIATSTTYSLPAYTSVQLFYNGSLWFKV